MSGPIPCCLSYIFGLLCHLHFTSDVLEIRQLIEALVTSMQVLLAAGGGHLVYLEIGDGLLTEAAHAQLEYDISCLDINPIGGNSSYSQLAAVGMWTDISVRIFSLPDLKLITKEHLGGEIIPRSVLLCAFEGVCPCFSFLCSV